MRIFEIGGSDFSGKSTQVRALSNYYQNRGFEAEIAPPGREFCDIYPERLEDRVIWYQNASPETIAKATIIGAHGRNQHYAQLMAQEHEPKDNLVFFDRGFVTTYASAIARLTQDKGIEEAKDLVDQIIGEIGYVPIEEAHIIFQPPSEIIQERMVDDTASSFVDYVVRFRDALSYICELKDSSSSRIKKPVIKIDYVDTVEALRDKAAGYLENLLV